LRFSIDPKATTRHEPQRWRPKGPAGDPGYDHDHVPIGQLVLGQSVRVVSNLSLADGVRGRIRSGVQQVLLTSVLKLEEPNVKARIEPRIDRTVEDRISDRRIAQKRVEIFGFPSFWIEFA
jgi:hypothetical protein